MNSDHVKKGMQQAPHRSLFNALGFTKEEMDKIMKPENFIGRCPQQVDEFIENCVKPVVEANGVSDVVAEINVKYQNNFYQRADRSFQIVKPLNFI